MTNLDEELTSGIIAGIVSGLMAQSILIVSIYVRGVFRRRRLVREILTRLDELQTNMGSSLAREINGQPVSARQQQYFMWVAHVEQLQNLAVNWRELLGEDTVQKLTSCLVENTRFIRFVESQSKVGVELIPNFYEDYVSRVRAALGKA